MSEQATCYISGCDRPAKKGGLCWGHVKRRQRRKKGQAFSTEIAERRRPNSPYSSPYDRCYEIALSFGDLRATDDEGWEAARERFRKALDAYAEAKAAGRRPPQKTPAPAPSE